MFRIVLFLTFRAIDSNQQQKIESFFLPGKGTPKYSTKITSYSIIWDCDVYVYSCFPLVRARKKGFTAQPPPTFLKYLSFIFSTLAMLCFVSFRYRQFSQLFYLASCLGPCYTSRWKEIESTIDVNIPETGSVVAGDISKLFLLSSVYSVYLATCRDQKP